MLIPTAAQAQRGCFTFRQALAAGWTKSELVTAIRRGYLVKVRPNVYAEATGHAALKDRDLHLCLIAAEQLGLGMRWHAARRSAAVVLDLPLIGEQPVVPQLVRDREGRETTSKNRHQRVGHLPVADRRMVSGLAVTSPSWTAVELARQEPFRNAVVTADAVLRRGVPRAELERCLEASASWKGVAQARPVVAFADGLAESALESISRVAFRDLDLPTPELQVEVWLDRRFLGRVDYLWRELNTIGEADGVAKFGETAAERAAAFREAKVRQEWLEDVGFQVPRWGWAEAWRPRGVLDMRLLRAFDRGRRQVLDPRVRFVPTSVDDHLRRAA